MGSVGKPTKSDTIVVAGDGFTVDGRDCATLVLEGEGDKDWWAKQNLSLGSYKTQHEERNIEADHLAVYKLFGAYVNAAAYRTRLEHPLVLDVGCGIFPSRSAALEQLDSRCSYVGLDPLPQNMERAYPFICGRIEDLASLPGFRSRFDLFVFGTSLDHLEALSTAAAAVRSLAAPGALLVCWNGLQDPERVISGYAVPIFQELLRYRSIIAAEFAYAGYGLLRLPRLLRRMRKRRAINARGEVGDHHLRWFTDANSAAYLSEFGEVIDTVTLPYTNHCFATVKISHDS